MHAAKEKYERNPSNFLFYNYTTQWHYKRKGGCTPNVKLTTICDKYHAVYWKTVRGALWPTGNLNSLLSHSWETQTDIDGAADVLTTNSCTFHIFTEYTE